MMLLYSHLNNINDYYLMDQVNRADLVAGLGLAPEGRVKHGSRHQKKNTRVMANIGCFAIIKKCCYQTFSRLKGIINEH